MTRYPSEKKGVTLQTRDLSLCPARNVLSMRQSESFIEQACSAKMAAGCWLSIYFALMTMDIDWVWIHKHTKTERNQNRATLTLTGMA